MGQAQLPRELVRDRELCAAAEELARHRFRRFFVETPNEDSRKTTQPLKKIGVGFCAKRSHSFAEVFRIVAAVQNHSVLPTLEVIHHDAPAMVAEREALEHRGPTAKTGRLDVPLLILRQRPGGCRQLRRELESALIAILRTRLQALQDHRIEPRGDLGNDGRGRLDIGRILCKVGQRSGAVRQPLGQKLVEQDAQRVHVRSGVRRAPAKLFGRHVVGGTHVRARSREMRRSTDPRHSEIDDLRNCSGAM